MYGNSTLTTPSTDDTEVEDEPFVHNVYVYTFLLLLILLLSLMGTISNSINMVVFWRLRKEDPINISLLALALSDLLICLTTMVFFVANSWWLSEKIMIALNIMTGEVSFLLVGIPHRAFVKITVLITAFIAFERCLCIVIPLKVGTIITHGRVSKCIVFIYCVGSVGLIPIYYTNHLAWVYVAKFNNTLLNYVVTDESFALLAWTYPAETLFLLAIPFVFLVVCTAVMIKHLRRRMNWRLNNIQTSQRMPANDSVPRRRETRIVKIVIIISIVFLVCYIPNIVLILMTAFDKNYNLKNFENQQLQLIYYSGFLLDVINSSINIFIYYSNSINYKTMLLKLLRSKRE